MWVSQVVIPLMVVRTEGWRVMKMFDYVGDNINNGNASNSDFERIMRYHWEMSDKYRLQTSSITCMFDLSFNPTNHLFVFS